MILKLFMFNVNTKYKAEQKPFLICYQVVFYNKETKNYELKDLIFENHLDNLKDGNFIIGENPFEKFLEVLYRSQ